MTDKKDILDRILTTDDNALSKETRQLDCLIYRDGTGSEPEAPDPETGSDSPASWKVTGKNVSVEIWEHRAKIKINVTSRTSGQISMKRLANIAAEAIKAELEKEGLK